MADVASTLPLWSTTPGSNLPSDATTIGAGLADNLQAIQAIVREWLAHKGSDIVSAATTDLGAVPGLFHDITGSTGPITSFGTVSAGIWKIIKFEGTPTLTHNATSLILPGGANVVAAVGDMLQATSEGAGNWRVNWYVRAASSAVTLAGTETLTNKTLTTPVINSATGIGQAILKRKTADESVTSSTTLQDDDHLLFAIGANEELEAVYDVEFRSAVTFDTHGIKLAVTVPSGATLAVLASYVENGGAPSGGAATSTTSGGALTFGAGNFNAIGDTAHVRVRVWVLNSTNAGNVTLQWAQATSSANSLSAKKGSSMVAHRIA